jgi:hypothetical protein
MPERFRSWLVVIAISQIQQRERTRGATLARRRSPAAWEEPADPDADFVDDVITRTRLAGERRAIREATGWLEPRGPPRARAVVVAGTARRSEPGRGRRPSRAEPRPCCCTDTRQAVLAETATQDRNSWNQTGWNTGLLRETDPRTAQRERAADGGLPPTAFLTNARDATIGAPMN